MVSAKWEKFLLVEIVYCLNPYYAGRWFLLRFVKRLKNFYHCLNPYYAGRWFLLNTIGVQEFMKSNGLNPYYAGRWFLL